MSASHLRWNLLVAVTAGRLVGSNAGGPTAALSGDSAASAPASASAPGSVAAARITRSGTDYTTATLAKRESSARARQLTP